MSPAPDALRCSFCYKAQSDVAKLITSPLKGQRVYICDECIAVCVSIIDDQGGGPSISFSPGQPMETSQSRLLYHPMVLQLLDAVERWIQKDSLGVDASEEFAEVRQTATQMITDRT